MNPLDARSPIIWDIVHPRPGRPWSGVGSRHGVPCWGHVDPHSGDVELSAPRSDRRLPALGRWLDRAELVSYRPGRRAVLRIAGARAPEWVKVLRPERTAAVLDRHTRPGGYGVTVPMVVGADVDEGWIRLSHVDGVNLNAVLQQRALAPRERAAVAASVAAFGGPPGGVTPAAGHGLDPLVDSVAVADPELAVEVRSALGRLPRTVSAGPSGWVHGDLHDKNLVVGGDDVAIIDLDGCRRGRPEEDVGNLIAHLQLRALQRGEGSPAMADGCIGDRLDPVAVETFRGWTLVRLACLYRFRRRWRHLSAPLLALS